MYKLAVILIGSITC